MVFKASNPLYLIFFLFFLSMEGFLWIFDWITTRYRMVLYQRRDSKLKKL